MKHSFVLSLLALLLLFALGVWKGVDVSIPIVSVTTAFVASRAASRASMVHSASKDPACDTAAVIREVG